MTNIKKKQYKTITILLIVLFISLICLTSCGNPFERKATLNDISLDTSQEISLNINYKLKPKVDINELEITFEYYDKNDKLLTTKIENVGNVIKNTEYTISVSFTEFSLTELFTINYVRANVTGGTVSIFN